MNRQSRRAFLKCAAAGLVTTAASALFPTDSLAGGTIPDSAMLRWKPTSFSTFIGQKFIVNGNNAHNLTFQLVQVQNGVAKIYRGPKRIVDAPADSCFLLVFSGPRTPRLTQNTYQFSRAGFGQFSLFITPGKQTAQGQKYLAVINHVHA